MNVLDLFSGIGGFSLGLERAGFETIAFCEPDPYCQKILQKHWPHIPIYKDVRLLSKKALIADGINEIDVIAGGFPCQPFSTAASGKNPKDTLSPEFIRLISEIQPKYVIAENTEKKAFSATFINTLKDLGYGIYPKRIGADDAGADHQRHRWWLCAYPNNQGKFPSRLDAEVAQLSEFCEGIWGAENYARAIRVPDGIPNRTHRFRCLGNAVIPQIPEAIGRAILND